jgi:hypothetical protein
MSETKNIPLNTKGADIALKLENIIKRMSKCMTQETLALQSQNRAIAAEMAEEKARHLQAYRALAEEVKSRPDVVSGLDPDIKKHIETMMAEFEVIMKDNIRVILSNRFAVKRLIQRIMDKAREAASSNHQYYNAQGKIMNGSGQKSAMVSTQLNETF